MNSYGWKGSLTEFLSIAEKDFLDTLSLNIYERTSDKSKLEGEEDFSSQLRAWRDCYKVLQNVLKEFEDQSCYLLFEYSILRGSGRRPDVLLFLPGEVLVIEFKMYPKVSKAEYTQTSLYVRDLQNYHQTIQQNNVKVSGILISTSSESTTLEAIMHEKICSSSPIGLQLMIQKLIHRGINGTLINTDEFLRGEYVPLPSIIESAKAIFKNEDLPQIKSIKSSNFNHVIDNVKSIIQYAKETNTHHLVLVSGVPGAGKTFVGLKLVHETDKAVYLTGNRPLVNVLQDSLNNNPFVKSLYGYKTDYLQCGRTPKEQVIIFDEAQRAWDAERMKRNVSEPDVIVQIAKHEKPWSVIIGLIGEGQEIHHGEESGIGLWNNAIHNQQIYVHSKYQNKQFTNAFHYQQNENLHLNCSLRTHEAISYFDFVNRLLAYQLKDAAEAVNQVNQSRYTLRITDNLVLAKSFVTELYKNDTKTYGIIHSSGVKGAIKEIPYAKSNIELQPVVEYFNYPHSKYYCKNLNYSATEFHTQGLELDMAIVCWEKDLFIENNQWTHQFGNQSAKDPLQMKLNAYRVLLTRGRDGTIIYIPKEMKGNIWGFFKDLGIMEL